MDIPIKIILAVLFVPLIFILLLFISTIPFHNVVLSSFSNDLFSISPAEGEDRIEQKKEVGILQGNGNHCDYYAGIVLKTEKDEEEIKQHYISNYKGDSEIQIIDVRKYLSDSACDSFSIKMNCNITNNKQNTLYELSNSESLYIVYIFEHGMTSRFGDVRCS